MKTTVVLYIMTAIVEICSVAAGYSYMTLLISDGATCLIISSSNVFSTTPGSRPSTVINYILELNRLLKKKMTFHNIINVIRN